MEIIDFIIWGAVLLFGFLLVVYSLTTYKLLKEKAKERFKNRLKESKDISNCGKLNNQVRSSVRLFHSMYLTKEDIEIKRKELNELP